MGNSTGNKNWTKEIAMFIQDSVVPIVFACLAIAAIAITAIYYGHDGAVVAGTTSTIGAIVGYRVKGIVDNRRNNRNGGK